MKRVAKTFKIMLRAKTHDAVNLLNANETKTDGSGDSHSIHSKVTQPLNSLTVASDDWAFEQQSQYSSLRLPAQLIEFLFCFRADGIHADCHL